VKTRLTRQVVSDIRKANGVNRVHDNLSLVHAVAMTCLDLGPYPDTDAASYPAASNSFAKTFSEHHRSG
jgi:hypothetical protein